MNIREDYVWKANTSIRNNNPLLPLNIRGLIVGKGNCGITTLLLNLLLQSQWSDYYHFYLFARSLHQQQYQILRTKLQTFFTSKRRGKRKSITS